MVSVIMLLSVFSKSRLKLFGVTLHQRMTFDDHLHAMQSL